MLTLDSFTNNFFGSIRKRSYSDRPTSVYQALYSMTEDEFDDMVNSLFPEECADDIGIADIVDKIKETNTCSGNMYPVEVWIDPEGQYRLTIYKDSDIINNLPKTADGIPIVPGMKVWSKNGIEWRVSDLIIQKPSVILRKPTGFGRTIYTQPNECYSKNPNNTLDSFPKEFFYSVWGKPTSIYQTLMSMSSEDWCRMRKDIFFDNDKLTISDVIDKIKETNRCSSTDFPVEVWIDPEGQYKLTIYS